MEGWYLMPKHPLISIPLDIPDVRVLETELTKEGELILTIESTLTSTRCRRCGRTITERYGVDEPRLLRHLPILGRVVENAHSPQALPLSLLSRPSDNYSAARLV
jgi:hypothetical protein